MVFGFMNSHIPSLRFEHFGLAAVLVLLGTTQAVAQSEKAGEIARSDHFEKKIRPALVEYCLDCHANDTEANGGLLLDSKSGWETGGDSGPAILPGDIGGSRLLTAIRYNDRNFQMPPDGKLPEEVIADFETWVAEGAFDPRVGMEGPVHEKSKGDDSQSHWAYQPIRVPSVPIGNGESDSVVDAFINDRLRSLGIAAASPASRYDQVRRLFFDLTGLPPNAEVIDEVNRAADFDVAYLNLVDRLLASPYYGEAFARRWMDVARYAESVTLRGLVFKEAWRYRDYLVAAFSEDRPFDLMIREQVAGDLMQAETSQQRWQQLAATTFLAMGDTNFEKQDKQQLEMDFIDEQLDVLGQAFLGQTLGCARCHDHKFDPIPTKDYYALAGVFRSAVALRHSNVSNWVEQPLPLSPEEEQAYAELESRLKQLSSELAAKKKVAASMAAKRKKEIAAGAQSDKDSQGNAAADDEEALAAELKTLESQQQTLQQQVELRPKVLSVSEELPPHNVAIHVRGDVHNLGEVVPRGFLTAVRLGRSIQVPEHASGRLEFAAWLSADDNPLTARVAANRFWLWLMGQGIVDTPNNFGTSGSAPSHPELLDWLAAELIRSGWSSKHVVRLIVLSDAYRRRILEPDEVAAKLDPENRYYWRGQLRRLTAEELRDTMLVASGEMELAVGGSTMKQGTKSDFGYQHTSQRRTIYQPVFRNALPDLLDAFDFATTGFSTGSRARTTVATQPLALMNNAWVHARAAALASKLMANGSEGPPPAWVRAAYQTCFQREPTAAELEVCLEFFEFDQVSQHPMHLERLVHSLLASIDFRYLR